MGYLSQIADRSAGNESADGLKAPAPALELRHEPLVDPFETTDVFMDNRNELPQDRDADTVVPNKQIPVQREVVHATASNPKTAITASSEINYITRHIIRNDFVPEEGNNKKVRPVSNELVAAHPVPVVNDKTADQSFPVKKEPKEETKAAFISPLSFNKPTAQEIPAKSTTTKITDTGQRDKKDELVKQKNKEGFSPIVPARENEHVIERPPLPESKRGIKIGRIIVEVLPAPKKPAVTPVSRQPVSPGATDHSRDYKFSFGLGQY